MAEIVMWEQEEKEKSEGGRETGIDIKKWPAEKKHDFVFDTVWNNLKYQEVTNSPRFASK